MADYNIQVKIDPAQAKRGAQEVEKALEKTGTAADRMGSLIKRALAFTGLTLGIRELGALADAYTNIQNRLKTVTQGTAQLSAVTDELFRISNQTRSQFEATAEVYTRVALASKDMGISQKQTLEFTKSLNQAVILSGASAQEATAGMIQLSQGLASGTLRGDELRSVLEQLPAVADVIAKGLGVTRGELRAMGEEGKITAEIVLDSFAKAREELNDKFAKTVPTLGQAFIVLRNNFLQALGAFDQGVGVTRTLAKFVLLVAENIGVLTRAVIALSSAFALQLAQRGIGAATAALKTFTVLLAANPIGAIATALTVVIAALVAFSDKIQIGADGITTLRDYGIAAFQIIKESIVPLIKLIGEGLSGAFVVVQNYLASFGLTFRDVLNVAKIVVNSIIGYYVGLAKAGGVIFTELRDLILRAIGADLANTIIEEFKMVIGFLVEQFTMFGKLVLDILGAVGLASVELGNAIGASIQLPELTVPQGLADFGGKVKDAFLEGFNQDFVGDFVKMVDPAFAALQNRAQDVAQKRLADEQAKQSERAKAEGQLSIAGENNMRQVQARQIDEIIKKLVDEGKALGLTNAEREVQLELLKISDKLNRDLTAAEQARIATQLRVNQGLKIQGELYQEIVAPATEYMETQKALNALLQQGKINADQYALALQQTSLASSLQDVRLSMAPPDSGQSELSELSTQLAQRNEIIRQAQEARLISEQEALALSLEANKQYNQQVLQTEADRYRQQLSYGQTIFSSLTSIAETYAGQQSGIYQAMFRLSKAFAIADSTVKIIQGIAAAAANPWPANLAAMASVAAATAGLVAQIQGTNLQGFQNGGSFRVGGSGGTDSQLVAFRASPNETVAVRTPGQDKQTAQAAPAAEAQPITVLNVTDPSLVENYLNTPAGERLIVNTIQKNGSQLSRLFQ